MKTLKGSTVLITGASSGFGAEFARQLAPHAHCLLLVARRRERLDALASEIARPGLTVHCFAADLSDENAIQSLLRDIVVNGEQVTFLINNAGVGDHGFFEDAEWPRVQSMLDVNILALTRLTHGIVPQLVRSGRGAILNVSSIAGYLPMPKMAVYAATKSYVTSFTEALRAELRGSGVTVSAVCPGPVDTEFFDTAEREGSDDEMTMPDFFKVTPAQVVRDALHAVIHDRARVVPGLPVCIAIGLVALIPIFLLRLLLPPGRPTKPARQAPATT